MEEVFRVHFVKEEFMPFQLNEAMNVEISNIKAIEKEMKIAKIKRFKKPSKDVLKMSYDDFLLFTTSIKEREEVYCDFVHSTHFGKVLNLILCISEIGHYPSVI